MLLFKIWRLRLLIRIAVNAKRRRGVEVTIIFLFWHLAGQFTTDPSLVFV